METANAAVTNDMIAQVMSMVEEEPVAVAEKPVIVMPPVLTFDLPGGYTSPAGEIAWTAEVRELNGRDEEQIAKTTTLIKALNVVLSRGLTKVGDFPVDDMLLNNMLAGDRDYVLMRIYAATFGEDVTTTRFCPDCQRNTEVSLNLLKDVKVRELDDPSDRRFTVQCSVGPVVVDLPTGHTQKLLMASIDKSVAELSTILLENTVTSINGNQTLGRSSVLELSIRDRRLINEVIAERSPGPQMQDASAACSQCGAVVEVPLSVAALFQL